MSFRNRILVLLFFIAAGANVCGQTRSCDSVYQGVDVLPVYAGGMNALMEYFIRHGTPVLTACEGEGKDGTTKLNIVLTITTNGNVSDVEISNHKLRKDCEEQLKNKLLSMTGWTAGRLGGKSVCSRFEWVVSCIKWN